MWWQFTLAGLLVGALVGMTGMGSGSLVTPIPVILFVSRRARQVGRIRPPRGSRRRGRRAAGRHRTGLTRLAI
jgi:hypothetical protein